MTAVPLALASLGGRRTLHGLQSHEGVDTDEGAKVEGVDVDLDLDMWSHMVTRGHMEPQISMHAFAASDT